MPLSFPFRPIPFNSGRLCKVELGGKLLVTFFVAVVVDVRVQGRDILLFAFALAAFICCFIFEYHSFPFARSFYLAHVHILATNAR